MINGVVIHFPDQSEINVSLCLNDSSRNLAKYSEEIKQIAFFLCFYEGIAEHRRGKQYADDGIKRVNNKKFTASVSKIKREEPRIGKDAH